ncbi:MAG: MBL fold metallo-hydrolase [Clostridium sp.]|nr:MBL fold metallo-hydrolase [Clostridium sp.]
MNQPLLYVFGTGNATVTRYYNTCFAIKTADEYFMVDAGGGNGILGILERMEVPLTKIHHIFVTHEHTDHILGIVWMIRMIATAMKKGAYEGDLSIYCHDELPETIRTLCRLTIQKKFYDLIGKRIRLIPVSDGETRQILNMSLTFFDIHSTKARQFGFTAQLSNGQKLCCAGDEPLHSSCEAYAADCGWLLHEAFCLYEDREQFKPYEKHHNTVKEACELAERLRVRHLVLWHTEEKTLPRRQERYTEEGARYYHGTLLVPEDGEILPL